MKSPEGPKRTLKTRWFQKMFKTVTTIIITVIVVLFSIQNFDHVPVDFFFGKPIHIRLIFVIAIAGVTGYLIRHFIGIEREEKLKRQVRLLGRRSRYHKSRRSGRAGARIDHDYDEF